MFSASPPSARNHLLQDVIISTDDEIYSHVVFRSKKPIDVALWALKAIKNAWQIIPSMASIELIMKYFKKILPGRVEIAGHFCTLNSIFFAGTEV